MLLPGIIRCDNRIDGVQNKLQYVAKTNLICITLKAKYGYHEMILSNTIYPCRILIAYHAIS